MSTDSLSFSMGQIVYLKIDTEEAGMVTGILFRPTGHTYAVTWASNLEESFHYDIELTVDKACDNTIMTPPNPAPAPRYKVTITKVLDKGTIKEGETQSHPIFEGYTLKGLVADFPRVGERWVVPRTEKNGVKVLGLFTTSEVTGVYHNEATRVIRFDTANSEYLVQYELDSSPSSVLT